MHLQLVCAEARTLHLLDGCLGDSLRVEKLELQEGYVLCASALFYGFRFVWQLDVCLLGLWLLATCGLGAIWLLVEPRGKLRCEKVGHLSDPS